MSRTASWLLVLVATSTMAVSYVDRQAMAVLAPTITTKLHIGETAFGALGSMFSVAYLVAAPLGGRYIERVGARRGLVASALLWSVVAGLHSLALGIGTLALLRLMLGISEAPAFPAAAQTVSRVLPPELRSAGFGVLFTGSSLGAALAAVGAPWLEGHFGWRIAVLITSAVGLLWVPLWLLVTRSPEARSALDARVGPSAPVVPWRELALEPAVIRAMIAVVGAAPAIGFVLLWGAKLLVARHGLKQEGVGHYLWLPPVIFDLGSVGFGALASALARSRGIGPRPLFAVAAVLALAVVGIGFGVTPWQTTIAASVALAGGGGMYALCTADLLNRLPADRIATTGGVQASAQSLALIVAFPIIGAVITHAGYLPVGVGLAAWCGPCALVWLLWNPAEPKPRRDVT